VSEANSNNSLKLGWSSLTLTPTYAGSPYDDADMDALAARLKTQQVKFNAVVSGDGGDEESWNDVK